MPISDMKNLKKRASSATGITGQEREKALRDTQILSIHEMEELRRVQEMRIDEFSRHELRATSSRSKSSIYVEPRPQHAT